MNFVVMQEPHLEECVELATTTLLTREPIYSYLKPPADDLRRAYREVWISRAIRDGISVVAIDTEVNKVVGASINYLVSDVHEVNAEFDESGMIVPEFYQSADKLEDELRSRLNDLHDMKAVLSAGGKCMEMLLGVVSDEYQGRGIARQMVQKSIEFGKLKGARMAYSVLSNPVSQHIFKREFQQVGDMIEYKTYEVNGQKPFSGMPDDYKGATVVVKKLS